MNPAPIPWILWGPAAPPDSTGEFANSLFWVILYSLLLSWVTAISTTPLLCALLLAWVARGGAQDPVLAHERGEGDLHAVADAGVRG